MLQITVHANDLWDESRNEFISTKEQTLQLEHSLVSLSKWESKWCKPFLSKEDKTREETLDYIRCMTITQHVSPDVYYAISNAQMADINAYIDSPMSATVVREDRSKARSREPVTSELIYYWMIALNIPFECQKWHLNRLLTLIKVCNSKNEPAKKMSKKELMSRNTALNEARKKQLNSKG